MTQLLYSLLNKIKMITPSIIKSNIREKISNLHKWRNLLYYVENIGIDELLWTIETIEIEYGHLLSVQQKKPLSKDGNPIPWYTYPSLEYLNQLDFRDKDVFEYGAGNSSLFWAKKARSVVSVESDEEWYISLRKELHPNQKILFIAEKQDYINSIFQEYKKYDLIVIDGLHRLACSKAAIQCLASGGLIILDNSDWLPETAKTLREAGLIQVDFTGLGPINYYTSTTSIFLDRNFAIKSRSEFQPEHGIRSLIQVANPE